MNNGWLWVGILLAVLGAAAGGYVYGAHITYQAWQLADTQLAAAEAKAEVGEQIRRHATDIRTDAIDAGVRIRLVRLQIAEKPHQEITRHAIEQAPNLHRIVLPHDLVQLRREQAAQSAVIAATGAKLGQRATMSGADR